MGNWVSYPVAYLTHIACAGGPYLCLLAWADAKWTCWCVAGSQWKGWGHQLRNCVLPATGERWEGDGLKLLVLSCRQAVFDGLFQLFFTFVGAPLGNVTVDDKFGCESTGLADGGWDAGEKNSR